MGFSASRPLANHLTPLAQLGAREVKSRINRSRSLNPEQESALRGPYLLFAHLFILSSLSVRRCEVKQSLVVKAELPPPVSLLGSSF